MEVNLSTIMTCIIPALGNICYKSEELKTNLSNIEIPNDDEYDILDLTNINNLSVSLNQGTKKLKDKIWALGTKIQEAENDNFKIGDKISLAAGIKYYETGLGQGRSGTIGSNIRPEGDEYIVDRVAFYINGRLIANINDTGADIQECKMKYAEEYGVNIDDVELSLHVSYEGDKATGWLDRSQISYDDLNKETRAVSESLNNIDIENALEDIEKKYEVEQEKIENKVIDTTGVKYDTMEYAKSSDFWASVGEGAANAAMGPAKILAHGADFATLGAFDLSDRANKYQDEYQKIYRENGSYLTDGNATVQELSGDFLVAALAAASLATLAPQSTALATQPEVLTGEVVEGSLVPSTEVLASTGAEVIEADYVILDEVLELTSSTFGVPLLPYFP